MGPRLTLGYDGSGVVGLLILVADETSLIGVTHTSSNILRMQSNRMELGRRIPECRVNHVHYTITGDRF